MDEKDIEFKLEFEAKLHKLKIRQKFIDNLKLQNRLSKDVINYLNEETSWNSFIDNALCWSDTKEGHSFWQDVSRQ